MSDFNARTQKSRVSAGWSHDNKHYTFMRSHDCDLPFVSDQKASHVADAILGVLALLALLGIVLLMGGY